MKYIRHTVIGTVLLSISLFLSGCASMGLEAPTIVTKTQTIVVSTPSPLLLKCPIKEPPAESDYLAVDMSGRENLLTNYTIDLLKDLKNCNDQIETISVFQTQQIKLYGK